MERIPPGNEDDERSLYAVNGPPDGRGSGADRRLWRRFAEATTPKALCQSWLALQCRMLKEIRCAMVLLGTPDRGPFTPVAVWPNAKHNVTHLSSSAEQALKERRGLLIEGRSTVDPENPSPETYHIAYPIEVSGKLHGVVVLEVEQHPMHQVQAIMRQLHWGAAWIEVLIRRNEALKSAEVNERLQNVLDLVASAVEHEDFQMAAMGFVTRLATSMDCDRVSLGFVGRKHIRVAAMSHSADFGKETNLVRAIGSAMDEATDQNAVVTYPSPPDVAPLVMRAHEELSRQHGLGSILTIPLEHKGRLFGALTLERPDDKPFERATVEACEAVAVLAGPVLNTKRTEDRWLIRKVADSFATQLRKLLGPGYLVRKLVLILLLGLVAFFSFATVDYRVTAPTSIEGAVQRALAAPFDGFIKEAPIRPGDPVKKGEVLCLLDDRDLKLEHVKWSAEKEQLIKQYHEAMAKHERAQMRILKAKIDQAEAQLSLIRKQLVRTKIVAPFKGVVMSGDLSQSLGAPVERGKVLFEVAPLDAYRVIAEVDERDIAQIGVGQRSELVLPSMPGENFPFVVEKITPVSKAEEGRNYFRVEGRLEQTSERLRPGMEGIGKIKIDRRKLIWVWTHKAIDWLRLQLWRWRP